MILIHFRRTQFTEEDEEHLSEWIAQKIPYKETGGRTGNRLYQQLCEQVSSWPSTTTHIDNCFRQTQNTAGSRGILGNLGANGIRKMLLD